MHGMLGEPASASRCSYINGHYDVAGLCRDFPRRVRDLVDKKGERLKE